MTERNSDLSRHQNRHDLPHLDLRNGQEGHRRIAIITTELVGFHRNGGIGTCYTNLACALAQDGHDVHVVLAQLSPLSKEQEVLELCRYKERDVHVHLLNFPKNPVSYHSFPHARCQAAHAVYLKLAELDALAPFDLVHVSDGYGLGLDCLRLKHQGLAFQKTLFLVGLHSPTLWVEEAQGTMNFHADLLTRDVAEKSMIALADMLWSPSQYLLDWVRSNDWQLPPVCFVKPYLNTPLTSTTQLSSGATSGLASETKRLVFFGRLEPRKGIYLFLNALASLHREIPVASLPEVIFLGKSVELSAGAGRGQQSAEYIKDFMGNLPYSWRIEDHLEREEALSFLAVPGSLAVMPALVDNSPNTIYECLDLGIPFVASRTGGIPDLIHPEDLGHSTFLHHDPANPTLSPSENLAKHLRGFLLQKAPLKPSRPSYDPHEIKHKWLEWHKSIPLASKHSQELSDILEHPLPSCLAVCMATAGRRVQLIQRAIESLKAQTLQGFHFILINDGSTDPDFLAFCDSQASDFASRGWAIVHQENRYVGASRNRAASIASQPLLLFMDDDNQAQPQEVETFLKAHAHKNADLYTCGLRYLDEHGSPIKLEDGREAVFIPVGPDATLGIMDNCFGDINFMIRKDTFHSLGGFPEQRGLPFTDWVFLARAFLRGAKMDVIPVVLFDYTITQVSLSRSDREQVTSRSLLCQEYASCLPPDIRLLPYSLHFAMRDMGGGMCGNPLTPSNQLQFTRQWAEKTIKYYKERAERYENKVNWYKNRTKVLKDKITHLKERLQVSNKKKNFFAKLSWF